MYPDPNRVRTAKVTVRLDQYEHKLLQALAEYQGEQLSTLLRTMLLREAQTVVQAVSEAGMGATVPAQPA